MSKLPSWRLARHAYLDVLANLQGLLRIGGLWLLLSWTLMMLGRSLPLLGAAADLVVALGAAAVAVAWHRHILDDEPLTSRLAPVDRRVVRYFVYTVILAFVVGVVPLALLLMASGGAPDAGAARAGGGLTLLLVPAAMIACIYVAMRLQLIFPATAIDDQALTLARSWSVTDGNGWRLMLGFFMATLPVALAVLAIALFLAWAAEATGSLVLAAMADLAAVGNAWLQAPLIASFLSYAYLFFRQVGTSGAVPAHPA
jgi:hypothetical protein